MASSLLALLDDIATLLDDVALLSKVAAQKTTGVLGDDLALNAQQVAGVAAERELPVVWAVCKGSLRNKLILVPMALLISMLVPWLVTPLLMLGGAYLCFEGFEKLAHKFLHSAREDADHDAALTHALADPAVDLLALEREKVQGAIRTDFILSAEIIAITLGIVQNSAWPTQLAVLGGIAFVMTVGVYGLVAGIVKLDDAGLYLSRSAAAPVALLGRALLGLAPHLMRLLSVAGTLAMFLVGGGILAHGVPALHHALEPLVAAVGGFPLAGGLLRALLPLVADVVTGVLAGAAVLAVSSAIARLRRRIAN
jgi:predicted DNA repair protein MutK